MSNYETKLNSEVRGTKYERKYKEIDPGIVLNIEAMGILPIGTDEMFVPIRGCNTHYISNYGRCLSMTDRAKILDGHENRGKLTYSIPVWINELERVWKNMRADRLVVDAFLDGILEDDMYVWHTGNDLEDNYYRNLYPMGLKEYRVLKEFCKNGGFDTEEQIMEIINGGVYYFPTVLGVGYWGMPDVDVHHWTYIRWANMLERCYSDSYQSRQTNYIGCTVDEEWHNYSNFKKWAEENWYQVNDETMALDKDMLKKGNMVYSKDTCVFVPQSINSLILNCRAVRGECPIGVIYVKGKYRALMSFEGKQISLGAFETPEEAFKTYKEHKEKFIKDIAARYKGQIPEKLYQAMMMWEIEIDD